MDDVDFKAKVTRAEFEELCADLFERVPGPVQQALQSAKMNLVSGAWEAGLGQEAGGIVVMRWWEEGAGTSEAESVLRRESVTCYPISHSFSLCRMRLSR